MTECEADRINHDDKEEVTVKTATNVKEDDPSEKLSTLTIKDEPAAK